MTENVANNDKLHLCPVGIGPNGVPQYDIYTNPTDEELEFIEAQTKMFRIKYAAEIDAAKAMSRAIEKLRKQQ